MSAHTVVRLVGLAPAELGPTEHDGRYLARYEPEKAITGEGLAGDWLATTDDVDQALKFGDMRSAIEFTRRSIGTRPDGRPDRPLTSYSLLYENVT